MIHFTSKNPIPQNIGRLLIIICVVPFVMASLFSNANAQTKTPHIPANGFVAEAKQLVADCETNWTAANSLVLQITAAYADKEIARIEPKLVGPAYARASQVKRDAMALKALREPAGIDYFFRAVHQQKTLQNAADDLRATKNGLKAAQNAENAFGNHTNKRVKAIKKTYSLLANGNTAEAERTYDNLLKQVDPYYVWLDPKSRQVLVMEADETSRKLNSLVAQMRASQSAVGFTAGLKKNKPNIEKLLEITAGAVKSVGSTGKATLAGKELDGPDSLKQLVAFWRLSHSNLVRCMGIDRLSTNLDLGVKPKELIGKKLGSESYQDAIGDLSKNMSAQLIQLVKSDISRAGSNNDKAKYSRYLGALGELKNEAPQSLINACMKELAVVESAGGTLGVSIKNYTKITDDILLWRSRAAESQAKAAGEFFDISTVMATADKEKVLPNLRVGMDEAITLVGKDVVGKGAKATNLNAISKNAAFSGYQSRAWATVIGGYDLTAEIAELQNDLFVNASNPPLSLKAATAIATAKRKNIKSVGGMVIGLQVEAIGTRFPTLPASMNSLVPLNTVPDMGGTKKLDETLMRYNLKPQWVQHDYFFKKLDSAN